MRKLTLSITFFAGVLVGLLLHLALPNGASKAQAAGLILPADVLASDVHQAIAGSDATPLEISSIIGKKYWPRKVRGQWLDLQLEGTPADGPEMWVYMPKCIDFAWQAVPRPQ